MTQVSTVIYWISANYWMYRVYSKSMMQTRTADDIVAQGTATTHAKATEQARQARDEYKKHNS